MANLKSFKVTKHENVTIGGNYEFKLEPWDIIMLIGFKFEPTKKAQDEFSDIHDLRSLVANRVLGKHGMMQEIRKVIPNDWNLTLFTYSYDHTPQQIQFGKKSEFQIELHFDPPRDLEKSKDFKGMEKSFQNLAAKVASIKNFKSTSYYEITPSKNVK